MTRIWTMTAALLLLAPGAALAGHGKAGLWNVSTTMAVRFTLPPEQMAQMKKMGISMPGPRTIASQSCMTQAEVDSDELPKMDKNEQGCTTHMVSQTGTSMVADMVCTGKMQGKGRMQMAYSGAEHYSGSYNFQGVVEGNPSSMSSTFRGDWVKRDCGALKPDKR